MAEVSVRWLTSDPERGGQGDPVWRSNCSAAWSRKNSMALRRSVRVMPSAIRRSNSTERISDAYTTKLPKAENGTLKWQAASS